MKPMTGFITQFSKKISIFLALSLVSAFVFAVSSSVVIKNAELQLVDDVYQLSARADIAFDETVEEAINKGVPLEFVIEFQVVSPRKYWFDDEIVTVSGTVVLSYHALSRQYLVSRGSQQKSFETLSEAKDELANISGWKVLEKSLIDKDEEYKAALLMRLDHNKLPKVIQVDAIGSKDWNLTSQTYEWAPKEFK